MRRILISLLTTVSAVVAMTWSVPAAFAIRLLPPSGGANAPYSATVVGHSHAGLAGWELALIVAAVAVVVSATMLMTISRRRRVFHPSAA